MTLYKAPYEVSFFFSINTVLEKKFVSLKKLKCLELPNNKRVISDYIPHFFPATKKHRDKLEALF